MKTLNEQILLIEKNENPREIKDRFAYPFIFKEREDGKLECMKARYWSNDQAQRPGPEGGNDKH